MTEPKCNSVLVPKLLWDELENAFMIKSKELIREIAKTLRQDESVLLQEFRSKKTNLCLLELQREDEERYECSAVICTTLIAHRCRKPVAYGAKFCPAHEFFTMPTCLTNKHSVSRIQGEDIFVDSFTKQVFTINQERVGYMMDSKCMVFEIEEG